MLWKRRQKEEKRNECGREDKIREEKRRSDKTGRALKRSKWNKQNATYNETERNIINRMERI